MHRFLVLTLSACLLACGGEADFCDRYDASIQWSAVDRSYEARAVTGTIALSDGRTIRDDRRSQQIVLDRASMRYLTLNAGIDDATVAVVRFRAPEVEGTFALDAYEAELYYCETAGAGVSVFNGQVSRCTFGEAASTQRRLALRGSLVASAKPDVERDDALDYAYALHLEGKTDEGSTVNLDVVAFESANVSGGKRCGDGK